MKYTIFSVSIIKDEVGYIKLDDFQVRLIKACILTGLFIIKEIELYNTIQQESNVDIIKDILNNIKLYLTHIYLGDTLKVKSTEEYTLYTIKNANTTWLQYIFENEEIFVFKIDDNNISHIYYN